MQRRAVKSAMRTFEVLELFTEQRRPLRLHEIHIALQYPQSSTTNLLKSMVMMGYLNYSRRTRTYLPTTRVSALGNWLPGFIQSEGRYRRIAEELQRRTNETVGIAAQNDLLIQYIIMCTPDHEYKMPPIEGSLRTMVDATSGLALMSTMSDRAIDKICRYTNYYELGHDRQISLDEIMKEIKWIRHVGYSYRIGPIPEVASISMPLDSVMYGIPLAIGVGGLSERITRNKSAILATMRELVAEFEADMDAEHHEAGMSEMPLPYVRLHASDPYADFARDREIAH